MKKDEGMSGKKVFGYTDLDLASMKSIVKQKKISINDYTCALFSWTMYEYLKQEADRAKQQKKPIYEVPKTIRMAIPFSFRQPFKELKDVKFKNDFGSILMDLKLFDNFDDNLKDCKRQLDGLKTSLNPYGVYYLTRLPLLLPYDLPKMISNDASNKFSLIYTNLNASTEQYCFDGKRDLIHYFLVPGYG